jgi:hypothetical protein
MTWSETLARSLLFVALGTLVGSTAAATVTLGTEGGEALLTPLGALGGAAIAHGRFRMMTMSRSRARPARLAMGTALAVLGAGLVLGDLTVVAWALWLMTSATIIVTGMVATVPQVPQMAAAGWSPPATGSDRRLEVA